MLIKQKKNERVKKGRLIVQRNVKKLKSVYLLQKRMIKRLVVKRIPRVTI